MWVICIYCGVCLILCPKIFVRHTNTNTPKCWNLERITFSLGLRKPCFLNWWKLVLLRKTFCFGENWTWFTLKNNIKENEKPTSTQKSCMESLSLYQLVQENRPYWNVRAHNYWKLTNLEARVHNASKLYASWDIRETTSWAFWNRKMSWVC